MDYFEKNQHRIMQSSPVVPLDDPTLLFTNAGMVQFKNTFLGLEKRDYKRAASSQKCIRAGGKHNDLDNVGFTARHQTFFEMLGNFSFGDYFKEEAIYYAWEFVTKTLGLDPNRLYATVFTEDDDAEKLWKKIAPELGDRVLRFGEKDNYWSMGDTGPCGPCSEIHYDRGESVPGELNGEGDRFMEIWNLVFMQFNRDKDGKVTPLPKPSVDTGAGLERFCMILQNVDSNYSTDLFVPLIDKVTELSGKLYYEDESGVPHRVIADHIRALTFALAENVNISNEGRGYVLRRILRRAARHGHQLGLTDPFLYRIVQPLVDYMSGIYPDIKSQRSHIELVIKTEEEQFNRTLDIGIARFEDIVHKVDSSRKKIIPGEDVFKLYDTYGFPADLTEIMAHEKGFEIDWDGFNRELARQRERSKAVDSFSWVDDGKTLKATNSEKSEFVGYEYDSFETVVLTGDRKRIYLKQTPFYGESGGQVGDKGIIESDRLKFVVEDTKKYGDDIIHIGKLIENASDINPDEIMYEPVFAQIDSARRADIQRNHTATHLLHKALKMTLGDHVNQSGSLVAPDRLRFDFSHFKAMTLDEIDEVEQIVNNKIKEDLPVSWENMTFEQAKQKGAIALFGEKYGDEVRVVKTGDFTMELCGGTHVKHTADIGRFFILSESAIAAGIRRIEAITGTEAEKYLNIQNQKIKQLKGYIAKPTEKIDDRAIAEIKSLQSSIHNRILTAENLDSGLKDILDKIKKLEKEKSKTHREMITSNAQVIRPDLNINTAKGKLLAYIVQNKSPKEFMTYFDSFKNTNQDNTVIVCSGSTGQYAIASPDYDFAIEVNSSLKESSDAKGGGKPTIRGAMAVEKIDKAIEALKGKFTK